MSGIISSRMPRIPPLDSRFLINRGSQFTRGQNILEALKFAIKNPAMNLSAINKLKTIIGDNFFLAPENQNDLLYLKAIERIDCFWKQVNRLNQELVVLMTAEPINKSQLETVCKRLKEMGATRYSNRLRNLFSLQSNILDKKTSSISTIRKLLKEAELLKVELNPDILKLKSVLEIDIQILSEGLKSRALSENLVEILMHACEGFPNIDDPFLLKSTTPAQRAQIMDNGYIDKINSSDEDGNLSDVFEKLRKDVYNHPLHSWVHAEALAAVASVMPSQLEVYRCKAWDHFLNYLVAVNQQPRKEVANIIMLVLARIVPNCGAAFRNACLRKVYSEKTAHWMTDTEVEVLQSSWNDVDALTDPVERGTIATAFPSIEKIMGLVGLEKVKKFISELAENCLDPEYKVAQPHHFILLGNPGTGKTTVAKIIQKLLTETGIRSSSTLIESTGSAVMQMGMDKLSAAFDNAKGGVFFIDDAHALNATSTTDGKAIIELISDLAVSRWRDTSVILAGCTDGMESNLIRLNSGFSSQHFRQLTFDNYTDEDLGSIFRQMCENHGWKCANEDVVRAAAHRISRDRGRSTFANARAVDNFIVSIYRSALCSGRNHSRTFLLADVIGPKPDRQSNFGLKAALDELNAMIGLDAVKNEVNSMVNLVMMNYERRLRGEKPLPVAVNRVFLGSPGTGKTTVAKLYGRILKELDLLSDGGDFELELPSDLIGSSTEDSQKKVVALRERCLGKIIIIDVAYGSLQTSLGADAVNSIAGIIRNFQDEDIAIVLIGYEKTMIEKFREINDDNIAWRFSFDRPVVFDDFTNNELGRIAIKYADSNGLRINSFAHDAFIRSISLKRCQPNFQNASTVINLMNSAMAARYPQSKVLILEDFGLSIIHHDSDSFLSTLLIACFEAGYDSSHDKRSELITYLTQFENGGPFPADIAIRIESVCGKSRHAVMPQLRVHIHTILEGMKNAVSAEENHSKERTRLLAEGHEDEFLQIISDRQQQVGILNSYRFCSTGFSWHPKGEGWLCAGGTCYVSEDEIDQLY